MKNKNTFSILLFIIAVWILIFYTKWLYSNNNLIKIDINAANTQSDALTKKLDELKAISKKYEDLKTIDKIKRRWDDSWITIDKYIPNLWEDKIIKILTDNEDWIIINEIIFKNAKTLVDWLNILLIDVEFKSRNSDEISRFLEYLTWDNAKYRFFVESIEFTNDIDTNRDLIDVKMQLGMFEYLK